MAAIERANERTCGPLTDRQLNSGRGHRSTARLRPKPSANLNTAHNTGVTDVERRCDETRRRHTHTHTHHTAAPPHPTSSRRDPSHRPPRHSAHRRMHPTSQSIAVSISPVARPPAHPQVRPPAPPLRGCSPAARPLRPGPGPQRTARDLSATPTTPTTDRPRHTLIGAQCPHRTRQRQPSVEPTGHAHTGRVLQWSGALCTVAPVPSTPQPPHRSAAPPKEWAAILWPGHRSAGTQCRPTVSDIEAHAMHVTVDRNGAQLTGRRRRPPQTDRTIAGRNLRPL